MDTGLPISARSLFHGNLMYDAVNPFFGAMRLNTVDEIRIMIIF